jgi:hypothetical protein
VAISFRTLNPRELEPWHESLRHLERDIQYPVGDVGETFRIDHGADYHSFFSNMGATRFVLALDGQDVVATLALVERTVRSADTHQTALYLCDYKVALRHRGTGLGRRLALQVIPEVLKDRRLRRVRVAYGIAMRGQQGDLMRSATSALHPARLLRKAADLYLYFQVPSALAQLSLRHAPPTPPVRNGLDLSPCTEAAPCFTSTAGQKDLRLTSTGIPWPLVHLGKGPKHWAPTWGHYLKSSGERLVAEQASGVKPSATQACFAVDSRLRANVDWLAQQDIKPDAKCSVYAFRVPTFLPHTRWIHISTAEI